MKINPKIFLLTVRESSIVLTLAGVDQSEHWDWHWHWEYHFSSISAICQYFTKPRQRGRLERTWWLASWWFTSPNSQSMRERRGEESWLACSPPNHRYQTDSWLRAEHNQLVVSSHQHHSGRTAQWSGNTQPGLVSQFHQSCIVQSSAVARCFITNVIPGYE